MTDQTRQEIQRCHQRLADPDEPDLAGARQGLEDWFCNSLFEDGLMWDESGQTPDSRRAEADKLLKIIEEFSEQLTAKERSFVESIAWSDSISVKEIFWLRDIRDSVI